MTLPWPPSLTSPWPPTLEQLSLLVLSFWIPWHVVKLIVFSFLSLPSKSHWNANLTAGLGRLVCPQCRQLAPSCPCLNQVAKQSCGELLMTSDPVVLSLSVSNDQRIIHRTAVPPCQRRTLREALLAQSIPLDDALGHRDHVGALAAANDLAGAEHPSVNAVHPRPCAGALYG